MKRAGILLLALVVASVLAGPAWAAKPAEVESVDQTRAEVVRYWTAERMREAIPLGLTTKASGGKQRKAAIPFTR